MPDAENCSKCNGPLDTAGYPLWCKACRAKYRREYEAKVSEMIGAKNFQAGVNAIRFALAQQLARAPGSSFEGRELAKWIMEFPAPQHAGQEDPAG